MKHDNSLDLVLWRHRAFWEMEDVDTPLMSIGRYGSLQPRASFPKADGTPVRDGDLLSPGSVDVRHLIEPAGDAVTAVSDGFIRSRAPYDLCWGEAIAGCPIRWRLGHVWSDPFLKDLSEIERLNVSADNPWLGKLIEMTRLLVAQANGAYPISQPLLRGPVDIASAALGDEPFCWAMVDEPERFRRLLEVCTDVFIAIARAWIDETPRFHEGYCQYGIWAPGTAVRTQADNAALMSPAMYREFLLPCDERISAVFDYPLIHTHSGVLHIMTDALLELDALRAVQVSIDYPAGPSVAEILPLFKKINERKPLIITGGVTREELDLLLHSLSPGGLSLQVDLRSA